MMELAVRIVLSLVGFVFNRRRDSQLSLVQSRVLALEAQYSKILTLMIVGFSATLLLFLVFFFMARRTA